MPDFDDLVFDMDKALASDDAFGDEAVLSADGTEYPVQVIYEQGLDQMDYNASVIRKVLSIPSPPVDLATGYTVRIVATNKVYTLREEIDDDGYMPTWSVTENQP